MNEEEDRRRLKEKLKEALESAQRNFQLHDESEGELRVKAEAKEITLQLCVSSICL